jgi:glycosyltransferase involved in cell wall biosynthesis
MQRILFCSQTASPIGGVETWLDTLNQALDKEKWDPIVALVRGSKAHRPEDFKAYHPNLDTIEIDGRGLPAEGRIRAVMRCIKHVAPDIFVPLIVVEAHDAICRLKMQGRSIRYLMTVRGNVPAQIADVGRYKDFADLVVCPGALTCRLVEWAGVSSEIIRHVPNGATTPVVDRKPREQGEPIRLGYVGRMSRKDKRVLDLVPFVQTLEARGLSFSLDLVGDGPVLNELKAGLGTNRLRDQVRFHGRQPLSYIYQTIYPNLDCVLLFSASEAFGITLVEAMLHGVVPITSRYIGHGSEDFILHGKTALTFEVGNARDAAECVGQLSEDQTLLNTLGRQAKEAVKSRYTWEACIRGWEDALIEILECPFRMGNALQQKKHEYGRLEKIGLSDAVVDIIRRVKRSLFGVNPAMIGGEEWPWINRDHDPMLLKKIEEVSKTLDQAEANPTPCL